CNRGKETDALLDAYFSILIDELPSFHGEVDQVDSEVLGELAIVGDVEDDEVGAFPDFERAGAVGAAQGVRSVDGGGRDGFGGGQLHLEAGDGDHGLHVVSRGAARMKVRREGDGGAGVDERAGWGDIGLAAA